jgi:hypothetical protein
MPTGLAFDLRLSDFIIFEEILEQLLQNIINLFHPLISIYYK